MQSDVWVAVQPKSGVYHLTRGRIGPSGYIPTECGEGWSGSYSEWRLKWALAEGKRECINCAKSKGKRERK